MGRTIDEVRKQILIAGAIGDALGYAVEFDSWQQICRKYGADGITKLDLDEATMKAPASDDTQMTLFACQAIIYSVENRALDLKSMQDQSRWAFQQWYETQLASQAYPNGRKPMIEGSIFADKPEMVQAQAPGNTCMSALNYGGFGTTIKQINTSKGCGAVMRAAPYAFLEPLIGVDEVWKIAAEQGACTHGHVDGWAPGAAMAVIIARILKGEQLRSAVCYALSMLSAVGATTSATLLQKAVALSTVSGKRLSPGEMCTELGEGWTGDEALALAVYAVLKANTVKEAILIAANHRGDSDSTASMAGQIAAAICPMTDDELVDINFVDLGPLTIEVADKLNQTLNSFKK